MACSLVGISVAVLIIVSAGRPTQSSTPEVSRFDAAKLKDKTLWTRVNAEPYYISASVDALCRIPTREDYEGERRRNPHAGTYVTVYVNNAGREAMFSKEPRRFPEGSVIVKEKVGSYSEGHAVILYTLMTKRGRGYNPEVGDWEFSVASGDGAKIEASGKLESCQTCHVTRRASDFIFGTYLKPKS
jgi:hypothetical protein